MLVNANLRVVVNIANLYKGRGLDIMELINEGNMGLIEAARRFDRSQNIKFISYAVWWIRQNITRALAEKGRMIRISAEKELMLRRFSRHAKGMHQVIGGTFTISTQDLEGLLPVLGRDDVGLSDLLQHRLEDDEVHLLVIDDQEAFRSSGGPGRLFLLRSGRGFRRGNLRRSRVGN